MASKAFLKSSYTVQSKHDAYFTGRRVQVTEDGANLLCECNDAVTVVNITTGRVTTRVSCQDDQVTALALAPDNASFVLALKSGSLQVYNWPDCHLLRSFRSYHKGPVTTLCWDKSSTLLATGAADSGARVWDLRQNYCTHSLKGAHGVFGCLVFDSDLLKRPWVIGGAGNNIFIWRLDSGSSELLATLEGHHAPVTGMQVADDQQRLVSCGLDRVLILWDLSSKSSLKVVPIYESLSDIVLQPAGVVFPGVTRSREEDGKEVDSGAIYALVVGDKGIPAVWEVTSGRQVWKASEGVVPPHDQEGATTVNQLIYTKGLESVVMTTYDHSIVFARAENMDVWKQLIGYNEEILDSIFVGESDSHLVLATNSPQLRIYECASFSCRLAQGHSRLVMALSRHPTQAEVFASGSHDNTALLWRLTKDGSAVCLASAVGHTQSIACLTLGQGCLITGSKDTCLKKWSLDKKLLSLETEDSKVTPLMAALTEKAHEKDINSVCISVNGKLIATGSQDRTAKIWDASNLSLKGVLKGHKRGIWCVQFSPVDEILASASADSTIRLWTIVDMNNAATLEGHSVSVLRIAWVSRGLQLVSTSSDGLLKLWTVKSRTCVNTWDEHTGKAWALAVSHDGERLWTGGEDATGILWRDTTEEERVKELDEAARLASEEQTLSNLIKDKKWSKALAIAIRLNQPFRALNIVKALLDETPGQLDPVLSKLREDQLAALLDFATQWNTKTKHTRESQRILSFVLQSHLPEEIEQLPNWQTKLEGLLPYTERHFRRLSALHQASTLLKFMTASMSSGLEMRPTPATLDEVSLLRQINSREEVEATMENEERTDGVEGQSDQPETEDVQMFGDDLTGSLFATEKIPVESSDEEEQGLEVAEVLGLPKGQREVMGRGRGSGRGKRDFSIEGISDMGRGKRVRGGDERGQSRSWGGRGGGVKRGFKRGKISRH